MTEQKEWMFIGEAAQKLGFTEATIRRWIREKKFGLITRRVGERYIQIKVSSMGKIYRRES